MVCMSEGPVGCQALGVLGSCAHSMAGAAVVPLLVCLLSAVVTHSALC